MLPHQREPALYRRAPAAQGRDRRLLHRSQKLFQEKAYPHITKPDADNLAKCLLDALNGLAYPDDAQITALEVGKFYSDRDFVLVKIYSEEETNHANT